MHKIRLYVVQELQEEAPDEEYFDDDDYPPPMMQRRNSRRPSLLRQNVIQKDRKSDSVSPKLKQIRQEMNKCDVNSLEKSLSFSNRGGNLHSLDNGLIYEKPLVPPPILPKNHATIPRKSVFASPRIKQLALNLQEKMLERNAKLAENVNNNLQDSIDDDNNKYGVCRTVKNDNFLRTLTPIIENMNTIEDIDDKIERNSNNSWIIKNCEYDQVDSDERKKNRINDKFSSSSPIILHDKRILIQNKINQDDIIQDDASIKSNSSTGSTIVRRNNKLNRYMDYDLEQKIEVEIKMREGSTRLLAASRHRAQCLEAAKALLTSNERMSTYMAELQRRKSSVQTVSTARVSFSDLRVPLMWRDSDHFKNRGDYRRFAVFCLARIGTEIHDTALLWPVDRVLTDISFPDVLVFNNVPENFQLTLEIYSHILQEDMSIASTPRRIKRTIHSSISKTVGKKLAASLRDELNSGKMGPQFELMASARLSLDDTDDNIHTHDLVINNLENKNHALPLFGHFCCRLAAQPDCVSKEICTGNINLNGRNCWARLQGFEIQTWESRKLAEEDQSPAHIITVNRETCIQPAKSSKELHIINTIDGAEKTSIIKLDSSEEAQKWLRQLKTHVKDHLRWKHAAESLQNVPNVDTARNSFIGNKRQGSLYDETPLIESDYSSSRPTVQEIFGLSSNSSTLRLRSHSTSGTRKLETLMAILQQKSRLG